MAIIKKWKMDKINNILLKPNAKIKRNKLTAWRITGDGKTIILNYNNLSTYIINKEATLIWSLCDGSYTVAELIQNIKANLKTKGTNIDELYIENKVLSFLYELHSRGLINLE